MNQMMPASRNEVGSTKSHLSASEFLEVGTKAATSLTIALMRGTSEGGDVEAVIAEADRLLAEGRLQNLIASLRNDLATAITRNDVKREIGLLIAAFPNAARADLAAFGRLACEDVWALHPSRIALETACRQLRRTAKFVPTISEILEVIARVQANYSAGLNLLKWQPEKLEEAKLQHAREIWRRQEAAAAPGAGGEDSSVPGHSAGIGLAVLMTKLRMLKPRVGTADVSVARVPPKAGDPYYKTPEHRVWSKAVIARAGHRCEDCGRTDTRLYADHIREIRDDGERLDLANGRARCAPCHGRKTAAERAKRMAQRF